MVPPMWPQQTRSHVARLSMVFGVGGLARQLQPAPGARVVATQTTPTQILQVIFR